MDLYSVLDRPVQSFVWTETSHLFAVIDDAGTEAIVFFGFMS